MNFIINTPEGTRDRLFSECTDRREVQNALTDLFAGKGYAEISTPEVEFYDLFVQSGNPLPQESFLKIVDRSGKIMVMRPDCTTPIARVAATKLKAVALPAVEVHLSDVNAREPFRHHSYAGMACVKTYKGLGFQGYVEAVKFLKDYLSK